ncbi:MAG: hypothetical protein VW829_12295 [Deltaproteobacteria bacterium]
MSKNRNKKRNGSEGYIYVASNTQDADYCKIGKTRINARARINDINREGGAGQIGSWVHFHGWDVEKVDEAEAKVLDHFKKSSTDGGGREIFNVTPDQAVKEAEEVLKPYLYITPYEASKSVKSEVKSEHSASKVESIPMREMRSKFEEERRAAIAKETNLEVEISKETNLEVEISKPLSRSQQRAKAELDRRKRLEQRQLSSKQTQESDHALPEASVSIEIVERVEVDKRQIEESDISNSGASDQKRSAGSDYYFVMAFAGMTLISALFLALMFFFSTG